MKYTKVHKNQSYIAPVQRDRMDGQNKRQTQAENTKVLVIENNDLRGLLLRIAVFTLIPTTFSKQKYQHKNKPLVAEVNFQLSSLDNR